MKFKSKAHMVQELLSGKKFKDTSGFVIYYDEKLICPFRWGEDELRGVWADYDRDIWTEVVESPNIHKYLIDSYQKGQAWQYTTASLRGLYLSIKNQDEWVEPSWDECIVYRLHPHNELIQEHRNGAKIQTYVCGSWIEEYNPDWYEDSQYRVKPFHVHQNLIDSYQKGQVWQYRYNVNADWLDVTYPSMYWEPDWKEDTQYRLHPHNTLIQAHNNGADIQAYIRGNWENVSNPTWTEDIQYRIKPATKTMYEWMFKPKFNNNWTLTTLLLSEEEAKGHFVEYEYQKTGRSWEVEV